MVGRQPDGAREVRARFDDAETIGIGGRGLELADARTGVEREAHPAVGVGRRSGRRHHARPDLLEHRCEAAEVGGHELDPGPAGEHEPFGWSEEAGPHRHARSEQDLVEVRHQGAEQPEVVPRLACSQCVHQLTGNAGAEGDRERVGRLDQLGRCGGRECRRHASLPTEPSRARAGTNVPSRASRPRMLRRRGPRNRCRRGRRRPARGRPRTARRSPPGATADTCPGT